MSLLLKSSTKKNTCIRVQSSEMAYCSLQVVICCFLYFFLYVYLTYKVTKRLQLKSYTGEAYVYLYPAPACMDFGGKQQHEAGLAKSELSWLPLKLYMSSEQFTKCGTTLTSWLVPSADYKISNLVVRFQVGRRLLHMTARHRSACCGRSTCCAAAAC